MAGPYPSHGLCTVKKQLREQIETSFRVVRTGDQGA